METTRVRRLGMLLGLGAVAVSGACSVGSTESAADPSARAPAVERDQERQAVPVTVAPARRGDLVHSVAVDGEVRATRLLELVSGAGAAVVELPWPEGAGVAAGDLLVRFDCRDAELSLRRANADRQRALMQYASRGIGQDDVAGGLWKPGGVTAAEFDEMERLFARGLIPRRELEAARRARDLGALGEPEQRDRSIRADVGLSAAEVAIEEAELRIDRCVVRAPFAGTVAEVAVQVGQVVGAGEPLLTLVDLDEVEVRAEVLEADLASLLPGGRATMRPAADPDRMLDGRILRISPFVDATRRVGSVTLSVESGQPPLRSGSHVRVTMAGRVLPDRLIVPNAAVLYSDDRPLVMVVRDNVAEWEYVGLGETNGAETEILPDDAALRGVSAGELVVVDGNFTLAHGTPVVVTDPE